MLLLTSNLFMTTAWYWHLRFKEVPLWQGVLISWRLAFIEYCLAAPANRWGATAYSPAQLNTMQEVITLIVFAGFSWLSEPAARLEITRSASASSHWAPSSSFTLVGFAGRFAFRHPPSGVRRPASGTSSCSRDGSRPTARGCRDERHQSSHADHHHSQKRGERHAAAGLVD